MSDVVVARSLTYAPLASCNCHLMGMALPKVWDPELVGLAKVPAVLRGVRNPVNLYAETMVTETGVADVLAA
jgi:hypothetical protein